MVKLYLIIMPSGIVGGDHVYSNENGEEVVTRILIGTVGIEKQRINYTIYLSIGLLTLLFPN